MKPVWTHSAEISIARRFHPACRWSASQAALATASCINTISRVRTSDPVKEITELISAQRSYEMNSKVIQAADEMASTISKGSRVNPRTWISVPDARRVTIVPRWAREPRARDRRRKRRSGRGRGLSAIRCRLRAIYPGDVIRDEMIMDRNFAPQYSGRKCIHQRPCVPCVGCVLRVVR